jgi:hypothetical protein
VYYGSNTVEQDQLLFLAGLECPHWVESGHQCGGFQTPPLDIIA